MRLLLALAVMLLAARTAVAQNALAIIEVRVDRATHHTIGVQVLISGDANHNATITTRVRIAGVSTFRDAVLLFRVLPATVSGRTVPEQFAGTIFDVAPGQTYEIELSATDPDGGDDTRLVTTTTRPWPSDPASPRVVPVTNPAGLSAALQSAQPGDIIELANGTYNGPYAIAASGTSNAPIVIRGATRDGVVLDGQNCADCNVLEVSGSYVHVERLTIKSAIRGLRFLGTTAGNTALGLRIVDVVHGIGSSADQVDFTICDNIVAGRLTWPLISSDDAGAHNDDQGIRVDGSGHVVCHNDISGFGDPMINFAEGARAYDFYGNDIHEIYGDGTELDRAEGNVRLFHNRFTNVFTAISMQPIYGGPAYVVRNVGVNIADEQLKLKSLGGTIEPSGALVYHNTFVSPGLALNLQTPITQHNFQLVNNLFVGPVSPANRTVDWTATIDQGVFEGNGYFPDDGFWFGTVAGVPRVFATLAEAKAAGIEREGRVLVPPIFASALAAPATYVPQQPLPDVTLAATSNALDAAVPLRGINDRYLGTAGDLGAYEQGCPLPHYGPRPIGSELVTNLVDCGAGDPMIGDDAGPGPGPDPMPSEGGCCQSSRDARGTFVIALLVMLAITRLDRARRT